MHIHAGNMNPHPSLAGAQQSTLVARRADETRKKLFAASAELDAVSTSESAWMITAWAGGSQSGEGAGGGSDGKQASDREASGQSSSPYSGQQGNASQHTSSAKAEEAPHMPGAGPVSFWA